MKTTELKQIIRTCISELLSEEGGFKYNVANLSLDKARDYAESEFSNAGKALNEVIPDFDKNYMNLQKACKSALDIPRIDMPVIEPTDMKLFTKKLALGHIDIFKPYKVDSFIGRFPKGLNKKQGKQWVNLGIKDGDPNDDIIKGKWTKFPAKNLKPTQSQIWLEKLVGNIIQFGVPLDGSPITKASVIASQEGYILDGHHRYGQAMLANPPLKLSALYIPLDIKTLLAMGRSYGNAIGNKQKG
jgi:hypothetical protein